MEVHHDSVVCGKMLNYLSEHAFIKFISGCFIIPVASINGMFCLSSSLTTSNILPITVRLRFTLNGKKNIDLNNQQYCFISPDYKSLSS